MSCCSDTLLLLVSLWTKRALTPSRSVESDVTYVGTWQVLIVPWINVPPAVKTQAVWVGAPEDVSVCQRGEDETSNQCKSAYLTVQEAVKYWDEEALPGDKVRTKHNQEGENPEHQYADAAENGFCCRSSHIITAETATSLIKLKRTKWFI